MLFGHHPAHPHALVCALICHHAPFSAPRTLHSAFSCPTLSLRFPYPACSCHAACRVADAPLPPFPLHYSAPTPNVSLVSLKSTARDNEVTRSTFVAHVVTISDTHDVTRPSVQADKRTPLSRRLRRHNRRTASVVSIIFWYLGVRSRGSLTRYSRRHQPLRAISLWGYAPMPH